MLRLGGVAVGIIALLVLLPTAMTYINPGHAEGMERNDEINVNSVEGQPLPLDVSMSFELNPSRGPALYSTFRTDIGTIQHTYIKQARWNGQMPTVTGGAIPMLQLPGAAAAR